MKLFSSDHNHTTMPQEEEDTKTRTHELIYNGAAARMGSYVSYENRIFPGMVKNYQI